LRGYFGEKIVALKCLKLTTRDPSQQKVSRVEIVANYQQAKTHPARVTNRTERGAPGNVISRWSTPGGKRGGRGIADVLPPVQPRQLIKKQLSQELNELLMSVGGVYLQKLVIIRNSTTKI